MFFVGSVFFQLFDFSNRFRLMNGYYDSENPGQVVTKGEYWEIYDNQSEIANSVNTRKAFINLGVEMSAHLTVPRTG
mgnify:CR=1 FL=1